MPSGCYRRRTYTTEPTLPNANLRYQVALGRRKKDKRRKPVPLLSAPFARAVMMARKWPHAAEVLLLATILPVINWQRAQPPAGLLCVEMETESHGSVGERRTQALKRAQAGGAANDRAAGHGQAAAGGVDARLCRRRAKQYYGMARDRCPVPVGLRRRHGLARRPAEKGHWQAIWRPGIGGASGAPRPPQRSATRSVVYSERGG
jgi:hypothetical protein